MGHSEGGLIVPMVAAKNPDDIAFIVMLAGPGVPGNEILVEQSSLIQKAMGASAKVVEKNAAEAAKIYTLLRTEKDEDEAQGPGSMRSLRSRSRTSQRTNGRPSATTPLPRAKPA